MAPRKKITSINIKALDGTVKTHPIPEGMSKMDVGPPHNFINKGCMCYRNSVLQVLLNLPPIYNWLGSHVGCNVKDCIACGLRKLMAEYRKEKTESLQSQAIAFYELCTRKGRFWSVPRGGPVRPNKDQCDSVEFLNRMLDDICAQIPSERANLTGVVQPVLVKYHYCPEGFALGCQPYLDDELRRPCILTAELSRGGHPFRLARSVQRTLNFLNGGDMQPGLCFTCGAEGEREVLTHLEDLPPVLFITLNRFGGEKENVKNYSYIAVEEFLTLPDAGIGQAEYRLQGIVSHQGGPTGGHYISLVRAPGKDGLKWLRIEDWVEWVRVDDMKYDDKEGGVTDCTLENFLEEQGESGKSGPENLMPYILAYVRIRPAVPKTNGWPVKDGQTSTDGAPPKLRRFSVPISPVSLTSSDDDSDTTDESPVAPRFQPYTPTTAFGLPRQQLPHPNVPTPPGPGCIFDPAGLIINDDLPNDTLIARGMLSVSDPQTYIQPGSPTAHPRSPLSPKSKHWPRDDIAVYRRHVGFECTLDFEGRAYSGYIHGLLDSAEERTDPFGRSGLDKAKKGIKGRSTSAAPGDGSLEGIDRTGDEKYRAKTREVRPNSWDGKMRVPKSPQPPKSPLSSKSKTAKPTKSRKPSKSLESPIAKRTRSAVRATEKGSPAKKQKV